MLDAPHLYDRPGNIYVDKDGKDWPDNHLRYGALSQIAAQIAVDGADGWMPDLVHVHDWQAGLVPALFATNRGVRAAMYSDDSQHCLSGVVRAVPLQRARSLIRSFFTPDGMEFFGQLGFLKAGIAFSDKITTVSPTYARELLLPEFGMGLEGILRARRGDLSGILNGIDLEVWNPATDLTLPPPILPATSKRKKINRAKVEARFGLNSNPEAPLFCIVSRLTEQKGLDLLLEVLPDLVDRGAPIGSTWIG